MGTNILIMGLILLFSINISKEPNSAENFKDRPRYSGIDRNLIPYVDDYIKMAKNRGIIFTHQVTVGFIKIDKEYIIGYCHYGDNFREISIDPNFWNSAGKLTKKALISHELTHGLCGRLHDFGNGTPYSNLDIKNIATSFVNEKSPFWKTLPGYYPDNCPISIMNPIIPTEKCLFRHQKNYWNEMYNRCIPF